MWLKYHQHAQYVCKCYTLLSTVAFQRGAIFIKMALIRCPFGQLPLTATLPPSSRGGTSWRFFFGGRKNR